MLRKETVSAALVAILAGGYAAAQGLSMSTRATQAEANSKFPVTETQHCRVTVTGNDRAARLQCSTPLAGRRGVCAQPVNGSIAIVDCPPSVDAGTANSVQCSNGFPLLQASERCFEIAGAIGNVAFTDGGWDGAYPNVPVFAPCATACSDTTTGVDGGYSVALEEWK